MKTLITSKGFTYHPDWLFVENGMVSMKLDDKRLMSVVSDEFENCVSMHYESEYYDPQDIEGYTECVHMERSNTGGWLIILEKPKGASDVRESE